MNKYTKKQIELRVTGPSTRVSRSNVARSENRLKTLNHPPSFEVPRLDMVQQISRGSRGAGIVIDRG